MKPPSDPQLEAYLHRKLRDLPDLPAPVTLAPRVLARIQARARAWWRLAWWQWPLAAKAAFLALSLGLAGLLGGSGWLLEQNVNAYSHQFSERLPNFDAFGQSLQTLAGAAWTYAGSLPQTAWIALLAFVAAAYLFCLGVGSAFFRFAVKQAEGHRV